MAACLGTKFTISISAITVTRPPPRFYRFTSKSK